MHYLKAIGALLAILCLAIATFPTLASDTPQHQPEDRGSWIELIQSLIIEFIPLRTQPEQAIGSSSGAPDDQGENRNEEEEIEEEIGSGVAIEPMGSP